MAVIADGGGKKKPKAKKAPRSEVKPLTISPGPKVSREVSVKRAVRTINRDIGTKVVRVAKKRRNAQVVVRSTTPGQRAFGILGATTIPSSARESQRKTETLHIGGRKWAKEHPNYPSKVVQRRTIYTTTTSKPKQEIRTLAHEIGHELGLEHKKGKRNIMTQSHLGSGTKLNPKQAKAVLNWRAPLPERKGPSSSGRARKKK